MKLVLSVSAVVAVSLSFLGFAISAPVVKGGKILHDDFDGKLALPWKVIRGDETHVSLKKVAGALVITTQRGSIHGKTEDDALSEGKLAKNIHLVEIPFGQDEDWVATTAVSNFLPDTSYQQAGLIVYGDDDHYLKWGYEYNWATREGQRFFLVAETEAVPTHAAPTENESGLKKYWLRLTKHGNKYEYAWSPDGEKWNVGGEQTWGDGKPKRLGLLAKNGGNKDAAEIDAAFEFFDLRVVPAKK